ncbi:hypothetical protein [Clostridium oryzae]|uniref:HEAT repeat protein n=1 Tax=Clostridium oryzae TaxID=1450648 RepID=A0A1V4IED8_9CLOT|nr:hypothetical protein [Clostridium oryzae]OPJ57907.1 hypothetical protein CLORY_38700 [Clostridium oryzae]
MSKIESNEIQQFIDENLNKKFFNENVLHEKSAYAILDFTIHVDLEKVDFEKLLNPDQIKEIHEEVEKVKNEQDLDKLYNALRKQHSSQAVEAIIQRFSDNEGTVAEKFLSDMKRTGNDCFAESAARFFIKAKHNYADEIVNILEDARYPYTQSVLCYILGEIGSEKHIPLLYRFFRSLKGSYLQENFYEGPLLALYSMKARYKF